jgi:chaperone modulatory protein CbpM
MKDLEYCRILSIETSTLHAWIEERWIIPGGSPGSLAFEEADVARGRLILDLAGGMGVNEAGVDVVIDLVDQVNSLRERMRLLMNAIREQDAEVQEALCRALART